MADKDLETDDGPEEKKSSKLMLIIIILLVVVCAAGAAAFFLLGGDSDSASEEPAEPVQLAAMYIPIRPSFVVNFANTDGKNHFLQVQVTLMGRDPAIMSGLESHMPLVKSRLVDVFQSQDFEELKTPEGKEAMRSVALEEMQALFTEELGDPGIEKVLFTVFILQ
jgi:flagellar FliL protein